MALAGLFIASTAISLFEGRRQQKQIERRQEERSAVERAVQGEEAARARRKTIREAQVKRAEIANVAAQTGMQESTAVTAGTQQIQSGASENIGQIQTDLALAGQLTQANQNILNAQRPSLLQQGAAAGQQAAIAFTS